MLECEKILKEALDVCIDHVNNGEFPAVEKLISEFARHNAELGMKTHPRWVVFNRACVMMDVDVTLTLSHKESGWKDSFVVPKEQNLISKSNINDFRVSIKNCIDTKHNGQFPEIGMFQDVAVYNDCKAAVYQDSEPMSFDTFLTMCKALDEHPEFVFSLLDNNATKGDCLLGGDIENDCADCPYAGDFHFSNGECIRRE